MTGAAEMRKLLALELEHRRVEAEQRAELLLQRLPAAPEVSASAAVPALQQVPASTAEFQFGEAQFQFGDAPPASVGPRSTNQALLEAFREEARAAVSDVEKQLDVLSQRPDDFAAAARVERVYYTLRGSAASIGLGDVAELAQRLQMHLQRVLEGDAELDSALLSTLRADTGALLGAASLEIAVPPRAASTPPSALHSELVVIFQEEVSAALPQLQAAIAGLGQDPNDLGAASQLERIYHTLKGAAATVGLDELSKIAATLQQALEDVVEHAAPIDAGMLDSLIERTQQLLALAGLKADLRAPAASVQSPEAEVTQQYFLSEARQICVQALELEAELRAAPGAQDAERRRALARLFHRLKGSALLTTDKAVATEAERLQRLCEDPNAALVGEVSRAARLIVEALGLDPLPDAKALPRAAKGDVTREKVELIDDPALWEAFSQECSELIDGINKTILELESSDQPKRVLESLFRQYHTLKGAMNTVGLSPTGRELHLVEDFFEALMERPILPSMKAVTTFLLSVQSDVQKQLGQAKHGFVELSVKRVEAEIEAFAGGRPGIRGRR
ncbi:MAG: Hpt domain-containing protein [Polyangiaceae bacterium]